MTTQYIVTVIDFIGPSAAYLLPVAGIGILMLFVVLAAYGATGTRDE